MYKLCLSNIIVVFIIFKPDLDSCVALGDLDHISNI